MVIDLAAGPFSIPTKAEYSASISVQPFITRGNREYQKRYMP